MSTPAAPKRAKTTPDSTPGSFAPKRNSSPGTTAVLADPREKANAAHHAALADELGVHFTHDRFEVETPTREKGCTDVCSVVVPAGEYVLGDPCYVVQDAHWEPLLHSSGFFGADPDHVELHSPVGYIETETHNLNHDEPPVRMRTEVLSFGTAYGDGVYEGSDGNYYPVDAGMIGLVPVSVCDAEDLERALAPGSRQLANVVRFEAPTTCSRDADGTLTFGDIVIKTGDTDSEEDPYCADCGVRPTEGFSDLCYDCQTPTCGDCGDEIEVGGNCFNCEQAEADEEDDEED